MTVDEAQEYFLAMKMLRAREIIEKNSISLWPNVKPDKRKQHHKRLVKEAGYNTSKRVATASDLKRILGE